MNPNYLKYIKPTRDKNRIFALAYLGGHCKLCGSKQNLEFDHVTKTLKFTEVSQMLTFNRDRFIKELNKCQLLCKTCHVNKSIIERGDSFAEHGSRGMYTNHKCRCVKCKEVNSNYYKIYNSTRFSSL